MPRKEIEDRCRIAQIPAIHGSTLFRAAYKSLSREPWGAPGLPARIRDVLGNAATDRPKAAKILVSRYDHSVKFLFNLVDASAKSGALPAGEYLSQVESVLMPEKQRVTLCVSSQVGCRQGCTFCHTGRMGLRRNLEAGEIVGQVVAANQWISDHPEWLKELGLPAGQRVTNIVFMGMGEPLDNVEEVARAISIMTDPLGCAIALRRISVSTAGHIEGLKRMLELHPQIRLALSVHSPFDAERSRIMPINRRWPLRDVIAAIRDAQQTQQHEVLFQYTLIHGVNDSAAHAAALVDLIGSSLRVKVNLIPLNEIDPSRFKSPAREAVESFRDQLHTAGIRVMVRYSKGQDIAAACGQLVTLRTNA